MKTAIFFRFLIIQFIVYSATGLTKQGETAANSTDSLITIAAVGDVMMGTSFPIDSSCTPPDTTKYLPPDDGKHLFTPIIDDLKAADVVFCNLEGALLDGGTPRKKCENPKYCYLFRTPTCYVQNLVAAGFNMASLANNHARDFHESMASTIQVLDRVGITHSGLPGDIARLTVKNHKIGMIAFAPYEGLYDFLETETAEKIVAKLAKKFDILLVSFHGGAEGAQYIHVPDSMEIYYGEERGHLRDYTHRMIDAGADLVLGHGPHVPRGLELYKNRLIAYSLGNFCTFERFSLKGPNGLAFILKADLKPSGEFVRGKIIACKQVDPGGPQPDSTQAVIRLLARLSKEDFPMSDAIIDSEGNISIKKRVTTFKE